MGFDHGVGHPLLLLCIAKAPKCLKNKAFDDLDHYSEWPKVADAVIKTSGCYSPSPACRRVHQPFLLGESLLYVATSPGQKSLGSRESIGLQVDSDYL